MSSTIVPTAKSPNELLAEAVVAGLLAKGLVLPEKQAELMTKLAKGTANQQDWKLWLDLPVMKAEVGNEAH